MKTREELKIDECLLMMYLVLSAYLRLRHSYRRGSFRQVPPVLPRSWGHEAKEG